MHEMGIIIHLAKTLDDIAARNRITKIGSVTMEIGEVSGIVTELFEDAWDYFTKRNPVLAGSELRIETIPAVTYCDGCGKTYGTVAFGRTCPFCGSGETWLVRGNECVIKEIEAETAGEPEDSGQEIGAETAGEPEDTGQGAGTGT